MGLNEDWRRRSLAAVWHTCTQMKLHAADGPAALDLVAEPSLEPPRPVHHPVPARRSRGPTTSPPPPGANPPPPAF